MGTTKVQPNIVYDKDQKLFWWLTSMFRQCALVSIACILLICSYLTIKMWNIDFLIHNKQEMKHNTNNYMRELMYDHILCIKNFYWKVSNTHLESVFHAYVTSCHVDQYSWNEKWTKPTKTLCLKSINCHCCGIFLPEPCK